MREQHFRTLPRKGALLTRYIRQPALYRLARAGGGEAQLYKFHLRIYFIVSLGDDPRDNCSGVFRMGKIGCAKSPYADTYEGDKDKLHDMHDSHLALKDCLRFPQDYGDAVGGGTSDSVFAQIKRILTRVSELVLPDLRPYKESRRAFEVFGCDFLVENNATPDARVWLMEINATPGYAIPENREWITEMLAEGIVDMVLRRPKDIRDVRHIVPLWGRW